MHCTCYAESTIMSDPDALVGFCDLPGRVLQLILSHLISHNSRNVTTLMRCSKDCQRLVLEHAPRLTLHLSSANFKQVARAAASRTWIRFSCDSCSCLDLDHLFLALHKHASAWSALKTLVIEVGEVL